MIFWNKYLVFKLKQYFFYFLEFICKLFNMPYLVSIFWLLFPFKLVNYSAKRTHTYTQHDNQFCPQHCANENYKENRTKQIKLSKKNERHRGESCASKRCHALKEKAARKTHSFQFAFVSLRYRKCTWPHWPQKQTPNKKESQEGDFIPIQKLKKKKNWKRKFPTSCFVIIKKLGKIRFWFLSFLY